MEGIHEVLTKIDALELLVVRVTGFIGVLLICILITWRHIKSFGDSKRKQQEDKWKGAGSEETKKI